MKIHIATDHAVFKLKQFLINELSKIKHTIVDHGAFLYNPSDDYPNFCFKCAKGVVNDNLENDGTKNYNSLGIVIGGSGNGEQIAANKILGIRAALGYDVQTAKLSREHNNANIIGIGARMHTNKEALKIVKTFIDAKWSNNKRHKERIKQITEYEKYKKNK